VQHGSAAAARPLAYGGKVACLPLMRSVDSLLHVFDVPLELISHRIAGELSVHAASESVT
jgi:hypothetical protein